MTMDDGEGILIRQPQHLARLILHLNDKMFAETFGDVKLIFSDGYVNSYKAVLAQLSGYWDQLVRGSQDADMVYMVGVRRKEFIDMMDIVAVEGGRSEIEFMESDAFVQDEIIAMSYHDHDYDTKYEFPILNADDITIPLQTPAKADDITISLQTPAKADDIIISLQTPAKADDITIPLPTPAKDTFNISAVVTNTLTASNLNLSQFASPREISAHRMVTCILPDFAWPDHLNGPNFHSMNWGASKTVVFEVMGNRSFFTVLAEIYKNLPCSTPFSIQCDGEDKYGIFSLRDFLNGGTANNIPAFVMKGAEEKITMLTLLSRYRGRKKENPGYGKEINILLNGTYENLSVLTKVWRDGVSADTDGQELLGHSKVDKQLMDWLQSQANIASDGGEICCFCGWICHDQSINENFRVHMKKHVARSKYCNSCRKTFPVAEYQHVCTRQRVKHEVIPCSECDKKMLRHNLEKHLKTAHNIIEKVVVLKKCIFCHEKVPNISKHYIDQHKNDEISCQFCDLSFTNPTKFNSHVDRHKKVNSGFCDICQREVWNLKLHNKKSHSDKRYPCDHCDKVFRLHKTLEDHMKSVQGTREKKPCPECGNLYVNVQDHVIRFHRGFKKLYKGEKCNICQRRFQTEKFVEHQLSCKREETICHICSHSVVMIKQHLRGVHKIFDKTCKLCDQDFLTSVQLNSHLRSEHFPNMLKKAGFLATDLQTEDKVRRELMTTKCVELYSSKAEEEKIACSMCGYKNTTVINMMIHMKEHMGFTFRKGKAPNPEQEKVCPDCGKVFKSNVAQHKQRCIKGLVKLVFPETLDFHCVLCGKSFKKQNLFRLHLKTMHAGHNDIQFNQSAN